MDLYVDNQYFLLAKTNPPDDSFILETDSNYFSTFSLISERCNNTDIYIKYNGEMYLLGTKKNQKKTKDVRFFDIDIKNIHDLNIDNSDEKDVKFLEKNKSSKQRICTLKMLLENKENILENLQEKGESKLENISNVTQLLMLGEESITPIIQTFHYFFNKVDPEMLSFLIKNMEKTDLLEKTLYESYTKLHIDLLKLK